MKVKYDCLRDLAVTIPLFWYKYLYHIEQGHDVIFRDGSTVDPNDSFSIRRVDRALTNSNPMKPIDKYLRQAIELDVQNNVEPETIASKYQINIHNANIVIKEISTCSD